MSHILDWLPRSDLHALVLVCQSFYQLTFPCILRDLVFCDSRDPSPQHALLNLLKSNSKWLKHLQRISILLGCKGKYNKRLPVIGEASEPMDFPIQSISEVIQSASNLQSVLIDLTGRQSKDNEVSFEEPNIYPMRHSILKALSNVDHVNFELLLGQQTSFTSIHQYHIEKRLQRLAISSSLYPPDVPNSIFSGTLRSLEQLKSLEIYCSPTASIFHSACDWAQLLPASVRELYFCTFNITQLPENLQVLELEHGRDGADLTASMLATIFEFNSLEQLSLKNTSLSSANIPNHFGSKNLRRFSFKSRSDFDICEILRPIVSATQHLQILSLETSADVGTDQLKLALVHNNALIDFQLYGKRAMYNFDDLIEAARQQRRLERMNISYPCSGSTPQHITFLHSHDLSSCLSQLKEVTLRLPDLPRPPSLAGHSFKLKNLVPEHCLELCTIIVESRDGHRLDLYILLVQVRRYPSHRYI